MRLLLLALFSLLLVGTIQATGKGDVVRVIIRTELGNIELELYPDKAPATVANLLNYIDKGHYKNAIFHRAVTMDNQPANKIKIEVIQGGKNPTNKDKDFAPIKLERTNKTGVKHTDGVISMARDGADTATSDFFICVGAQPELDFGGKRNPDGQGFAAFGKVTKGMDVVRKIQKSPVKNQALTPAIKIFGIERLPQ